VPSVVTIAGSTIATSVIQLWETSGGLSSVLVSTDDADELAPQIIQLVDASCPCVVSAPPSEPPPVPRFLDCGLVPFMKLLCNL
jgi:hypothetical protein